MSDCHEELVMQGLQAAVQAAWAAEYGSGPFVARDYPDVDIDSVTTRQSPSVFIYEPASDFGKDDEEYTIEHKEVLFSILVRCAEGFTSTMQGQGNNALHLLKNTLFYEGLTLDGELVSCMLAGRISRQQGKNHLWIDVPMTVHIRRRD